jgi:hypothetical protein
MDNSHSPPDLYLGVADCIRQQNYAQATDLFALATLNSQFDAERVRTKTTAQSGESVLLTAMAGIATPQREQFATAVRALHADPQALTILCDRTSRIGYPTYYPDYLVAHHRQAPSRDPRALNADFDPHATWTAVRLRNLNCRPE